MLTRYSSRFAPILALLVSLLPYSRADEAAEVRRVITTTYANAQVQAAIGNLQPLATLMTSDFIAIDRDDQTGKEHTISHAAINRQIAASQQEQKRTASQGIHVVLKDSTFTILHFRLHDRKAVATTRAYYHFMVVAPAVHQTKDVTGGNVLETVWVKQKRHWLLKQQRLVSNQL